MNFIKVCRVCLKTSLQYVELDTPFELNKADNGKNLECGDTHLNPFSYLDCFRMCTQLELAEDDVKIPKSLCETCGIELRITYDFLQKAKRAHEILLKTMLKTKEEINENEWGIGYESARQDQTYSKNEQNYTNDAHADVKEVQTMAINENRDDDINRQGKLIYIQPPEEELVTVATSTTFSLDPLGLLQKQNKIRGVDAKDDSRQLDCPTNRTLKEKLKETTSADPKQRSDPSKNTSLDKPIKTSPIKPSCRGGRRELKETSLKKEIFLCHFCPRTYRDAYHFRQHTLTHEGKRKRNFPCEHCGQKFFLRITLNDHMKTHDTNRLPTFQCDECDKSFFHKSSLRSHKQTHGNEWIECLICGKRYVRQSELTVHTRTHSGDLPYKCPKCDRAFAKVDRLTRHIRSYHDGCRYKCNVCGREYMHQSSLSEHHKEHTGMPLKCSICDRGFAKTSRIHLHLKVAHKVTSVEKMEECIVKIETEKQYLRIKGITKPVSG